MPLPCLISVIPDPPSEGGSIEIEFSGSLPKLLLVEFTPPGEPDSVLIPAEGTGELTIPVGTTDIQISDPNAESKSYVSAVSGGG